MTTFNPPDEAARIASTRAAMRRKLPPPAMRKALRIAHGLTQEDMALAVGDDVSRQSIQQWESGATPRGAALDAYGAVLDRLRSDLDDGAAIAGSRSAS